MNQPVRPIRFYRHPLSGHAHRVELLLSMLQLPNEPIDVDMSKGAHKSPEFLAKNAFGQVPVIEDGDVTLGDSNAILVYLSTRYDTSGRWYPRDPASAARVQQWLSVAAGQLAFGPSAARRAAIFAGKQDESAKAIATKLFDVLDQHLAARQFLTGSEPTIADLALYSYTAHAPEGGVPLDAYANVRAWLSRIESLPGFVPMKRTPVPA